MHGLQYQKKKSIKYHGIQKKLQKQKEKEKQGKPYWELSYIQEEPVV